jgi:hypothetical protein
MNTLLDLNSVANAVIGTYVLVATLKERHHDNVRGWAHRPHSRDKAALSALLVLGAIAWAAWRAWGYCKGAA